MNNKKDTKSKTISKTMNFPLPQEEFEKLMTHKVLEDKKDICKLEPSEESNIIHVDFKTKKRLF